VRLPAQPQHVAGTQDRMPVLAMAIERMAAAVT